MNWQGQIKIIKNLEPKTVDEYIEQAPGNVRASLKKIRDIIRQAAPNAQERISWGMPSYGYKYGLPCFAAFKKHISLFVHPPIVAEHAKELKNYTTIKATVHFPLDKPLPVALIKKLVKAQIKKSEVEKEK